jgi:hypothetical protein
MTALGGARSPDSHWGYVQSGEVLPIHIVCRTSPTCTPSQRIDAKGKETTKMLVRHHAQAVHLEPTVEVFTLLVSEYYCPDPLQGDLATTRVASSRSLKVIKIHTRDFSVSDTAPGVRDFALEPQLQDSLMRAGAHDHDDATITSRVRHANKKCSKE